MENYLFTTNEKYAIVSMLILIMEADTIIHPKEIEYMDSILKDFAITIEDNDHMDDIDLQMCLNVINEMSEDKRTMAKEIFNKMACVDGCVDPREKQLLDSL
jgi:uncharacterized tellurite resistance protein B-like protein